MKAWIVAASVLFGTFPAFAGTGPSFDCSKAQSSVEKLICSDGELMQLDLELAEAYKTALRAGTVERELQFEWIRNNNECVRHIIPEQCLRDRFKQRIADLLGTSIWPKRVDGKRPTWPRPSVAETREVCTYVALRGPSIADELVSDGFLDANNDGVEDRVSIGGAAGSMGGDQVEFRPKDAPPEWKPVELGYKGFEWKDYGSLGVGWLKHGKHVYTLYFDTEEARHATYLGYIDPDNIEHVVCDFTAVEGEELRADDAASGPLCRELAQHGFIPLDMTSADSAGDSRDIGRVWTRVEASIDVDFQNIGRSSLLVLLAFEGTAGRGCEFEYYDASRNGKLVEVGHAHNLLMALQDVDLGAFTPGRTCNRNFARWFEYHGQIYFDNHSTGDAATVPFHQVKRIKAGKIQQLCHAEFKVTWQVKSIWPHL